MIKKNEWNPCDYSFPFTFVAKHHSQVKRCVTWKRGMIGINNNESTCSEIPRYVMHLNWLMKQKTKKNTMVESLPCTSFWEMLWVLMREESRRTSALKTHSWTGNSRSSLVRIIGFLLLSLTTVPMDGEFPLMLFALSCCCCCSAEALTDFWKALLDLKWFPVPLGIVPFEVSSYVSIISSFLFGLLWSFRKVRIFSPVIVTTVRLTGLY